MSGLLEYQMDRWRTAEERLLNIKPYGRPWDISEREIAAATERSRYFRLAASMAEARQGMIAQEAIYCSMCRADVPWTRWAEHAWHHFNHVLNGSNK